MIFLNSMPFYTIQVDVNELSTLYSNQEETDTRVVLYLHHAVALGYKNAVVRTPDTDIFVILLFHAHAINLSISRHRIGEASAAARRYRACEVTGRRILRNTSWFLCVQWRGLH